jgi:hypothetical protein
VITFVVGHRRSGVRVSREVVKFCESIVGALWHDVLLVIWNAAVYGANRVSATRLVGVPILLRNVILGHLACSDLGHVRILGVLHPINGIGFERVSLLD